MNHKPRQLKEGECPKCGSFETFIRHSVKYGDVSYIDFMRSGFRQPTEMTSIEFHCRECGLEDVIYGRDDLKAAIRSLKRGLKAAKTEEERKRIRDEIEHWQDIHDGADRIMKSKRLKKSGEVISAITNQPKKK